MKRTSLPLLRRREFITLLGGAAVTWPVVARAEQADRVKRVGVLMGRAESGPEAQRQDCPSYQADAFLAATIAGMAAVRRHTTVRSLDHLVGAGEQRRWHSEADGPRGLEVDDQLELSRLQDREIGRLFALENPSG